MSITPEILLIALRQYSHNDGTGLLAGFDYDETVKIISSLQAQVTKLAEEKERLAHDFKEIFGLKEHFEAQVVERTQERKQMPLDGMAVRQRL